MLCYSQVHNNMETKWFLNCLARKKTNEENKENKKKHEENDGSSVSVVKMGLMQHMKFA